MARVGAGAVLGRGGRERIWIKYFVDSVEDSTSFARDSLIALARRIKEVRGRLERETVRLGVGDTRS